MQVAGFTINLLTLLAIVLSVGLVVDDAIVMVENVERHLHEGKTPFQAALARRARAGRTDHRHDHHAGRGLHAGRHPGRAHRLALPRVRVHARRRGDRLRRRRAHAVADDGLASCCAPATPSAASRAGSTAASTASARATCAASRARSSTGRSMLRAVGDRDAADRALLHVLAEGAGAGRGPGRGVRHRPGGAELDARPDEAVRRRRSTTSTSRSRRRRTRSRSRSRPAASAAW